MKKTNLILIALGITTLVFVLLVVVTDSEVSNTSTSEDCVALAKRAKQLEIDIHSGRHSDPSLLRLLYPPSYIKKHDEIRTRGHKAMAELYRLVDKAQLNGCKLAPFSAVIRDEYAYLSQFPASSELNVAGQQFKCTRSNGLNLSVAVAPLKHQHQYQLVLTSEFGTTAYINQDSVPRDEGRALNFILACEHMKWMDAQEPEYGYRIGMVEGVAFTNFDGEGACKALRQVSGRFALDKEAVNRVASGFYPKERNNPHIEAFRRKAVECALSS